jgi:hypothetical protein
MFIYDKAQIFSTSLNGYNTKTNTFLEIKCPYKDENNNISTTWNRFF